MLVLALSVGGGSIDIWHLCWGLSWQWAWQRAQQHTVWLSSCMCRLKEEHSSKLKPLQELNEQLLAELTAKQQDSSQIAALQEQLARSNHRLELEASGRAELWQRCSALEQELQSMCDKLAVATKSLRRAEQQLGAQYHPALAGLSVCWPACFCEAMRSHTEQL